MEIPSWALHFRGIPQTGTLRVTEQSPKMRTSKSSTRNAVCICTDRNMLIPALFVADAVKSRQPASSNRYDVIVFSQHSEVTDTHLLWMNDRGIKFRDDLDMSRLSNLKQFSGRLTAATLMKLSLAEHLAEQYDRILYLDCDLTIHEDVGAIFSLDTGAYEIAAVPSGRILDGLSDRRRRETIEHFEALGMTKPYRYFNSGVLYIDVAKWNRARLGDRAIAYIRDNPDLCDLPDEDALNAILDGKIAELSPLWNMRPWPKKRIAAYQIKHPVIVHHMGEDKPWRRYGYRKRLFPDRTAYRLYEAFLKGTPWEGWLDKQWDRKDLIANITWEIRRITRRLRGKLDEPSAAQRRAHDEAAARYYSNAVFADVEQGLVAHSSGVLKLRPHGSTT